MWSKSLVMQSSGLSEKLLRWISDIHHVSWYSFIKTGYFMSHSCVTQPKQNDVCRVEKCVCSRAVGSPWWVAALLFFALPKAVHYQQGDSNHRCDPLFNRADCSQFGDWTQSHVFTFCPDSALAQFLPHFLVLDGELIWGLLSFFPLSMCHMCSLSCLLCVV